MNKFWASCLSEDGVLAPPPRLFREVSPLQHRAGRRPVKAPGQQGMAGSDKGQAGPQEGKGRREPWV